MKIAIKPAYRAKGVRSRQADEFVYFGPHKAACFSRSDGHSDDRPVRLQTMRVADGGQHGGPRRKTVVDQDDGSTVEMERSFAAIELLAAFHLGHFSVHDFQNVPARDFQIVNHLLVQDPRFSR